MKTSIQGIGANGHELPEQVVLLWFSAAWCGPCKQIAPMMQILEHDHSEWLRVVKVDTDEEFELAQVLGVRAVPTLVLLGRTKRIDTHIGLPTYKELNDWVTSHFKQEQKTRN